MGLNQTKKLVLLGENTSKFFYPIKNLYPEVIKSSQSQPYENNPIKKIGRRLEQTLHQRDYMDDKHIKRY